MNRLICRPWLSTHILIVTFTSGMSMKQSNKICQTFEDKVLSFYFFGIFSILPTYPNNLNLQIGGGHNNTEIMWYGYWCNITLHWYPFVNSLTTKQQTTKFSSANFQEMWGPCYIILRIQRLEGKQCRSRWGGSLRATSSRSTLFANSAIFVSGS